MLAAEINQKIHDCKQAEIKTYPCNNLRASNIGHPCERYLYLLIKHWDEQRAHDVGLQQIFDLGNHLESHAINAIKEAGYEVVTPTQRSWKVENPLITGREDIRVKDPENGQLYPAEIKWLSPIEYDRLNAPEDFYNSKKYYVRGYPAQLLVYEYRFEKEKGFFILGNKLTGEIKVIDFPFDWDKADALLKKGERVYAALEMGYPDILCATDDFYICDRCNLAHVCGSEITRAEADIDSGELAELLDEQARISAFVKKHNEISDEIKRLMGGREKVISGDYIVTTRTIHRNEYTVPESDYQRVFTKKI